MCVHTKEQLHMQSKYPALTLLCQQIHIQAQISDPFQPMGKSNLRMI